MWLQRNRCSFQYSNLKPSLMRDVENLASEFSCLVLPQKSIMTHNIIQVRWNLPSPGWFKLNTDGSALGCLGHASGGGLIQDAHGRWVKGFLRKIGKVNSLKAELCAIKDGLIFCNQLIIQNLYIELDTKAVISLLTSKNNSYAQYAPIIDDYRNMHPTWKIQHCYWESNACVDALAKKAVFNQQDFCLLDTLPVEMSQLLIQDLSGLFCNCVCNATTPVAGS